MKEKINTRWNITVKVEIDSPTEAEALTQVYKNCFCNGMTCEITRAYEITLEPKECEVCGKKVRTSSKYMTVCSGKCNSKLLEI